MSLCAFFLVCMLVFLDYCIYWISKGPLFGNSSTPSILFELTPSALPCLPFWHHLAIETLHHGKVQFGLWGFADCLRWVTSQFPPAVRAQEHNSRAHVVLTSNSWRAICQKVGSQKWSDPKSSESFTLPFDDISANSGKDGLGLFGQLVHFLWEGGAGGLHVPPAFALLGTRQLFLQMPVSDAERSPAGAPFRSALLLFVSVVEFDSRRGGGKLSGEHTVIYV